MCQMERPEKVTTFSKEETAMVRLTPIAQCQTPNRHLTSGAPLGRNTDTACERSDAGHPRKEDHELSAGQKREKPT